MEKLTARNGFNDHDKGSKRGERPGAEEKCIALVETAADAIFTLDLAGRFIFVNPATERTSGYGEKELVAKYSRELLADKCIPACINVSQQALRALVFPEAGE